MFTRVVVPQFAFSLLCSATLLGQQSSSASVPAAVREFPVVFEQNVVAGKTTVGTKIQAKLAVATLVEGGVIPRNATFSGEVIESVAKTASGASRLAIRVDAEQWKNGSASIKLYLTAWYYPTVEETGPDLRYGPDQPARRTWNGMGQYPNPNSPAYRPFPSSDSDKGASAPNTPSSMTSNHRIAMKNVESGRGSDGAVTLTCRHSNLKLDKLTTYVLAGDLQPPPEK